MQKTSPEISNIALTSPNVNLGPITNIRWSEFISIPYEVKVVNNEIWAKKIRVINKFRITN